MGASDRCRKKSDISTRQLVGFLTRLAHEATHSRRNRKGTAMYDTYPDTLRDAERLTYFMESADGSDTLAFAAPFSRDHWRDGKLTHRFDVTTIIVEDNLGMGRAEYSIWERNPSNGAWHLEDDEPEIVELLSDQTYDEPCADCLDEITYGDVDHSDDCPTLADDDDALFAAMEYSYFCCDAHRDAVEEAHRTYKKRNETTCSLYPDFVLLDGGDVLCRHHVAEAMGARWLWLGNDDTAEGIGRSSMLRQYFDTRRELGDEMLNVPSPRILRELASLDRSRRILDEADRERQRRDTVIEMLRDDVGQSTIAKFAGVSQQRVGQVIRDARERQRETRQRLGME